MRRCLCCRSPLQKKSGRPPSYCSIRCQWMVYRLLIIAKHKDKLPDLLTLPLNSWLRAYSQQRKENDRE